VDELGRIVDRWEGNNGVNRTGFRGGRLA
jgi:hypothetical protein